MRTLEQWEANFDRLDQCPWPGPRPLRDDEADTRRCIGRERDASNLVLTVKQHRLVILSGDSGVGKSSLVNVKLLAALRSAGYTPIVCKKWSKEDPSDKDEQAFIRRKILESLKECGSPVSIDDSGDLARDLDEAFGGLEVIVFDQFEELIRYQPDLFSRVADWILATNKNSRVRIVLSLRSEHKHRLSYIEQGAAPFSSDSFVLEPISSIEHIRQLVENSSPEARDDNPISPAAVEMILKHWQSRSRVSSGKWHGIGLLHLQATLYSLHALAKAAGGSMVDEAHIERFLKDGSTEGEPEAASKSFFEHGLREAVNRKLMLCEEACKASPLDLDRTLVEGTKAAAYRMIPHLSSGGYKLEREAWDLAELALDRELEQLVRNQEGPSEFGARLVYRELASLRRRNPENEDDLLTISRQNVLKRIPSIGVSASARNEAWVAGFDAAPWDNDPTDASAGPMLGFQRGEVLIEEIRRVVFAQHWLEAAQLIRTSSPEPDRTMLSLTHDGFADALEYWARFRKPAPSDALYMLTAAKGRSFVWFQEDGHPHSVPRELDGMPSKAGDPEHVTLVNLRWQDCRVSTNFRWVAFVNCDFTGTRFRSCRFEGVSFINCLLDKASFEECEIAGATRHVEPDRSAEVRKGTPSFKVEADHAKVSELKKYRSDGSLAERGDAAHIFSRTSGISAMPWDERYRFSNEFHREKGGLTMYGGRLSSLMIRACRFVDNGRLGLRFIAGSALDIVETSSCDLDIVSAAIRGLTITREVERSGSSEADVKVQVTDSWFNNCWFGDGLEGRAVFDDCLILQLFNLSNSNSFKVEIKDSKNDGVRNAAIPGPRENQRETNWMEDENERSKVAESVLKMDYRNQAAKMELGSRRK